jgi:hypothetical protein
MTAYNGTAAIDNAAGRVAGAAKVGSFRYIG